MLYLVFFVLLLLNGIALLALGRRGVLVGDALHCAACGFELTGVDYAGHPCGECGVSLTGEHAVLLGRREPRRGLIAAGGAFAVLGVIPIAGAVMLGVAGGGWMSVVPTGMLIREVRVGEAAAASEELLTRRLEGALTQEQEYRAIDAVLARQADRALPWDPRLGDFFEQSPHLRPDHWERYLENAYELGVVVRDSVPRGAAIEAEINALDPRVGTTSMTLLCEIRAGGHAPEIVDGMAYRYRERGYFPMSLPGGEELTEWIRILPLTAFADADEMPLSFDIRLSKGAIVWNGNTPGLSQKAVSVGMKTERTITLTDSPELSPTHVGEPPIDRSEGATVWGHSGMRSQITMLNVNVRCKELPEQIIHAIVLVFPDGSEIAAGTLRRRGDEMLMFDLQGRCRSLSSTGDRGMESFSVLGVQIPFWQTGIRLELRPDAALASAAPGVESLDMRVIELGEISLNP